MLLGLERGTVRLSPHEEEWHSLFEREKELISSAVGSMVISIQHIGSTAICGISAKPVLDLCVAIERFEQGDRFVEPLRQLGYEYKGEWCSDAPLLRQGRSPNPSFAYG